MGILGDWIDNKPLPEEEPEMRAPILIYQRGFTQVFQQGEVFALFTVCYDGMTRWMPTPARNVTEAMRLADHYEEGR